MPCSPPHILLQGLSKPITDVWRLRSSDQRVYLCFIQSPRGCTLLGGIKVGKKKLFIHRVRWKPTEARSHLTISPCLLPCTAFITHILYHGLQFLKRPCSSKTNGMERHQLMTCSLSHAMLQNNLLAGIKLACLAATWPVLAFGTYPVHSIQTPVCACKQPHCRSDGPDIYAVVLPQLCHIY